jgi:hypothetical protein
MGDAITIFDPNAPVLEAVGFEVNWTAMGIAAVALLVTALVLHRFLRRRLRASAVDLASDAMVRRLRLDRGSRRGLQVLMSHVETPVCAGVLVLNRTMLVGAAAAFRAGKPKASTRADVQRLMDRLGVKPVRLRA